jgi:LysM repeat protein
MNTIEVAEFTSQFAEIVDISGLTDEMNITYDVKISKTLVEVSPNEEDEIRNVSVNSFVEMKITGIITDTAVVITDAYSPIYEEKWNKELIKFEELSKVNIDNYMLKDSVCFDDIEILQVLSVNAKPTIKKAEISGSRVNVDAYLQVDILLKSQNGINSYIREIDFSYVSEGFFSGSYDTVSINAELSTISYTISGNNCIEIRANIMFNTRLSKVTSLDLISEIILDKDKKHTIDRAPIVAYFVKEGDSLFSIAKKYKTTISNLMKINNITNENEIKADSYIIIE